MRHERLCLSPPSDPWKKEKYELVLFPGTWEQCHCNGSIGITKRSLQSHHRKVLKINGFPSPGVISCRCRPKNTTGNFCSRHTHAAFWGAFALQRLKDWCLDSESSRKEQGMVRKNPEELKHHALKWLHKNMICKSDCNLEMHFLALQSTNVSSFNSHSTCNLAIA